MPPVARLPQQVVFIVDMAQQIEYPLVQGPKIVSGASIKAVECCVDRLKDADISANATASLAITFSSNERIKTHEVRRNRALTYSIPTFNVPILFSQNRHLLL